MNNFKKNAKFDYFFEIVIIFCENFLIYIKKNEVKKKPIYFQKNWINFNNRIVNHWNSLPDSVVFAKSLNSFKANLDKHRGIPFI